MSDNKAQIHENQVRIEKLEKKVTEIQGNLDRQFNTVADVSSDVEDFKQQFKARKCMVGHYGKIYAMDWGNDETTVLSAAQDGALIVWNALTNNKLHMINLISAWVMSCGMSPSGQLTASGGLDNTCSIYKLSSDSPQASKKEVKEQQAHRTLTEHSGYLSGAVFMGDEKIITSSGDGTCILWDVNSSKVLNTFVGHTSDVMAVSLIPNESTFISGSCDHTCKIWDHRQFDANVQTFAGHVKDVNTVSVSQNQHSFVSAGDDSKVILHDRRSYGPLQTYSQENMSLENLPPAVTAVAFSHSSRLIFAGYDDASCLAWDTLKNKRIDISRDANAVRVSCLGVNTTGNALCTGGWDLALRIWC